MPEHRHVELFDLYDITADHVRLSVRPTSVARINLVLRLAGQYSPGRTYNVRLASS